MAAAPSTASAAEPPPQPGAAPPQLDAAPPQLLVWHAPTGCGSASAVQARVQQLLGEQQLEPSGIEHVDARVSETRAGWSLHLAMRDALGTRERELEATECNDLVEAAAIAISLAFEAARAESTPAVPSDEAAPAEPAPPRDTSAPSTAPASPPDPDSGAKAQAGAELIIDLNSLAAAAAGPSLFGALAWDAASVALMVTWLPGADKSIGPAQSVEFSLLSAGLRACYALGHGLLDTSLCAGLDAGQLTARGAGLIEARVVRDPWLAAQAGLALSRDIRAGFALVARGELIVPLLRQGYAVNETEAVHRVSSVGGRIAVGARIAF